MVLGYLLARAGVDVLVLEKHADFLRDFRGDTIHPSTLEILHELGLLDEFLKRPHQEIQQLTGYVGGQPVTVADFTHLPTHCQFIALMPQWDFLDFIAEQARRYAGFRLRMQAEVTDLIEERGKVVGRPRQDARRAAGSPRRADHRRRRPPLDGPRRAGLEVEDIGSADRRPLDEDLATPRRPEPDRRPVRSRADPGDARPRRLLAMRVRDRQGGLRRGPKSRPRSLPRGHRQDRPLPPRPRGRDRRLVQRPAPDRHGRPPPPLVPARPALHRRLRARHVAGRRGRHQPGDPGRRGDGQPPGPSPPRAAPSRPKTSKPCNAAASFRRS